jgi:4-aminobutyrate aminotransferase-like enzyme
MNMTEKPDFGSLETRNYIKTGLREMATNNDLIGDIRGTGLFV